MGVGRGRRTGMVLILIIIIVLVVVLAGGFFIMQILGNAGGTAGPSEGPSTEPTETPVPTTVDLIVAKRDIPRGTRLTKDDVTTLAWPVSVSLPLGALTVELSPDAPGLEQVDKRIAKVDILEGQPVLDHMITPGDQPADLSQTGSDAALVIPAGQVAIAFPLNRMSGVAYALRGGDHVDVLVSFRVVDVDEDFQTALQNKVGLGIAPVGLLAEGEKPDLTVMGREEEGPFGIKVMVVPSEKTQRPRQVTQLLIDNVIVLRVGAFSLTDINQPIVVTQAAAQPTPAEGQAGAGEGAAVTPTPAPQIAATPDIVTLVMSRQDALVLKYALETGADIDFALRSALDNQAAEVPTDSVTLQYIIDFYNVASPPRLSIAQDPRIDLMLDQTGVFSGTAESASGTPEATAAPGS